MKQPIGKIDTLAISGQIEMPLVILQHKSLAKTNYIGFIPGLTKKDVNAENLETCKQKLKDLASNIIENMAINNLPFPFFPTKEEILKDFENVCFVSFIKIKSNKRKNNIG